MPLAGTACIERAIGIVATRTFAQPSHRLENGDFDARSGTGDKVALEPVPTSDDVKSGMNPTAGRGRTKKYIIVN